MAIALQDPTLLRTQAFLGGKWSDADSGATFAVRDPASGEPLRYSELFTYEPVRQILTVVAEFRGRGRQYWRVPLTQRQFFPAEIEALLHYNGFDDIRFEPDFVAGNPTADVDSLAIRCRLRQGSAPKGRRTSRKH